MGQLEKYGLYVLCLVIFLILGVTIWGGGEVPANPGRTTSAAIHAPGSPPAASPQPAPRPSEGSTLPRTLQDLLAPGAGSGGPARAANATNGGTNAAGP